MKEGCASRASALAQGRHDSGRDPLTAFFSGDMPISYALRAFEEQILQHHSIVMRLVMRGEHQRDPTALRKRT